MDTAMRRMFRLLPALLVLSAAFLLAACQRGEADLALLQAPEVGDLYAAELSAFSDYEFTDDKQVAIDPAYGLMKVVAVEGDGVVVVTENAALGTRDRARSDIKDTSDIAFDDSERISISKADLAKAYEDDLIYVVRRPTAD
ncbi:hypothetical protein WQ56_13490 [Luteimonas sp. FCS-9]|nr:hypothetical protein WQ56_13490 [Luteimonas sp. FCS-9]